ncbi:hypothetical protein B484DRAFT_460987, partial [Ochromonadaceae sp. CCMP2298]
MRARQWQADQARENAASVAAQLRATKGPHTRPVSRTSDGTPAPPPPLSSLWLPWFMAQSEWEYYESHQTNACPTTHRSEAFDLNEALQGMPQLWTPSFQRSRACCWNMGILPLSVEQWAGMHFDETSRRHGYLHIQEETARCYRAALFRDPSQGTNSPYHPLVETSNLDLRSQAQYHHERELSGYHSHPVPPHLGSLLDPSLRPSSLYSPSDMASLRAGWPQDYVAHRHSQHYQAQRPLSLAAFVHHRHMVGGPAHLYPPGLDFSIYSA